MGMGSPRGEWGEARTLEQPSEQSLVSCLGAGRGRLCTMSPGGALGCCQYPGLRGFSGWQWARWGCGGWPGEGTCCVVVQFSIGSSPRVTPGGTPPSSPGRARRPRGPSPALGSEATVCGAASGERPGALYLSCVVAGKEDVATGRFWSWSGCASRASGAPRTRGRRPARDSQGAAPPPAPPPRPRAAPPPRLRPHGSARPGLAPLGPAPVSPRSPATAALPGPAPPLSVPPPGSALPPPFSAQVLSAPPL